MRQLLKGNEAIAEVARGAGVPKREVYDMVHRARPDEPGR